MPDDPPVMMTVPVPLRGRWFESRRSTPRLLQAPVRSINAEPPARPALTTRKEPLHISILTRAKRRFKAHATLRGLGPNQLFVEVWLYDEANHDPGA
jgi:hypothetical protein